MEKLIISFTSPQSGLIETETNYVILATAKMFAKFFDRISFNKFTAIHVDITSCHGIRLQNQIMPYADLGTLM